MDRTKLSEIRDDLEVLYPGVIQTGTWYTPSCKTESSPGGKIYKAYQDLQRAAADVGLIVKSTKGESRG